MRILHVNNQASVAYHISRYQRRLGHRSDVLARPNPYQKPPDVSAGSMMSLYLTLLKKAPGYDLVHVHGGIGISGLGLLPYKAFGKRFFAHYHGSELRRGVQTMFHSLAERLFVSTPDLLRYSGNVGGRELIHVPNPVSTDDVRIKDWKGSPEEIMGGGALKLVHMPTVRSTKGTDNVIKAVSEARSQGVSIDLDIIEDVTTDQAIGRLERGHVCVDWMSNQYQIHGVVSLEAMVRGIPTICNIDPSLYPSDIPIIRARPEGLANVLVSLVRKADDLPRIAEESRRYVLKYHHPLEVAKRIDRYL